VAAAEDSIHGAVGVWAFSLQPTAITNELMSQDARDKKVRMVFSHSEYS
jgi:hypothetical protein